MNTDKLDILWHAVKIDRPPIKKGKKKKKSKATSVARNLRIITPNTDHI
jgi:hypothetical protein